MVRLASRQFSNGNQTRLPSGDAFVHHLHRAFTSPIQKGTNGCENRRPSTGCGGHVDDQFLFVKCDEDNRHMWGFVESFDDCTNALINGQQTRLLGLGIWKERKQWPFEWLTSSPNIKVLGIVFCPTVKENRQLKTIAMNLSQLQTKVRRSLWKASNRRLTVLQKV